MTKYGGSVGAAVSIALPDLAFAQGQVAPVLSCARLNVGLAYWGNIYLFDKTRYGSWIYKTCK